MRHPKRSTLRLVAGLAGLLLLALVASAAYQWHVRHHAAQDSAVHAHHAH